VIALASLMRLVVIMVSSMLNELARHSPQRRPSDATLFALCWAVFCLVFFSISKSKLPGYILPAVPPIGLLLSRAYVRLVPQDGWTFRLLLLTGTIVSILVAALVWSIPFSASRINARAATGAGWVLLLFGIANLLIASNSHFRIGAREGTASQLAEKGPTRHSERSLRSEESLFSWVFALSPLCVVPILAILVSFNHLAPLFLPWDPSGKTLAQELRAAQIPPEKIYVTAMRRGQQYSLSFYMHQEIQAWNSEQPKEGYLLRNSRNCGNFVKPPWVCATGPVELDTGGWFVYKVQREDSMSNRVDGGALGGSHRGSGLNRDGLDARNRHPR
ncbi:MAG: hypothetical protein ACHQT6_09105, partial [Candidatus Acidiferrales bacterium]